VNLAEEEITESTHTLSLNFSWEMDLWGRLADETAAAGQTVLSQREDYLLARDSLAARVIQAWIDQVSIRRSIEIETERIEVIQRIETVLMERFKDGIGSLDELSAARSRTEIARADLSARETGLMQSVRKMEVLLGRYPEGALHTGTTLPHVASPRAGIPATALLTRPDVRAAMARLAAARHTAGSARKARLPSLTLSGEVLRESARLGDIGGGESYWGILGSLFQPLFEGGRLKHEAMAREIEAEAELSALRDVILTAAGEVESVLDALKGLDAQIRAIDAALKESEISSRYFEERYRQGLDSIQTLLTAKEQEMALKERQNELSAEKLKNRIDLALALGAGVADDKSRFEGDTEE
jgi:NodT family efflux transporter outer membrane factor (OMF) lipoprotein